LIARHMGCQIVSQPSNIVRMLHSQSINLSSDHF
jgi:hypothetical protein